MPPGGAVGLVDPLTLATGDVREALMDPKFVLFPEAERVGVRPARVHATDEEWNKIGAELLQRGVVVEITREDAPVVDGQVVLVGAFGVKKAWDSDTSSHTGSQADRECNSEQQTANCNQR